MRKIKSKIVYKPYSLEEFVRLESKKIEKKKTFCVLNITDADPLDETLYDEYDKKFLKLTSFKSLLENCNFDSSKTIIGDVVLGFGCFSVQKSLIRDFGLLILKNSKKNVSITEIPEVSLSECVFKIYEKTNVPNSYSSKIGSFVIEKEAYERYNLNFDIFVNKFKVLFKDKNVNLIILDKNLKKEKNKNANENK